MVLSNPSQILLRSPELLVAQTILVVNFNCDGFASELRELNPTADIHLFSYNQANGDFAQRQAQQHQAQTLVSHELPKHRFDLVIYYYPKAKAEALMTLDNIRACINDDAQLLVVGEKKGGVKSIDKQLKGLAHGHKVDSAKHCQLYQYSDITPLPEFDISRYEKRFCLTRSIAGEQVSCDIVSLPGVFNHGQLDDGTALLLDNLPDLTNTQSLLDFGCGAGVIISFCLKRFAHIKGSALDVNALAAYASEQTLRANDLHGNIVLSDGLTNINERFDIIVSNPPFHTGLKTDYDITARFFANAKAHLNKGGALTLVANSFLAYPEQLQQQFSTHQTIAKTKRFAVYQNQ
ncbi:methyltransferase [Pseudoalteromonas ruthenica]|uniref:methyltransferase n=1 Tax=Pseudoalteromonas ruthenica TaxID=151081 RepID=UPI00110AA584|nr:methyltransferase [Pseudoalteromonas ruthenica]TMO49187.1 16S rRNA methyltransferase [Pseudoalteromonas ruthenica]TMO51799.1 16S rRNA methyltransferase [Pseudoalteromonas ruthenica]